MDGTYWTRVDSNSANNPALNLTGDPSLEITFIATSDGVANDGDLLLDQPAPGTPDPDTWVEINGQRYQFIYELTGTLPTTANQGSTQVPDPLENQQVALITVLGYPADGESVRLVFLPEYDATQAEMNMFGTGAIRPQFLDETPPDTPVCFAGGTLIETPRGPVLVDDLRQGDLVMTVDDGPQPLVWVTSSHHVWPGSDEKFKPVQIKAGALGAGLPRCDLMVSPQHQILLGNHHGADMFGAPEVIAPAKGLTGLAGVRQMKGKKDVTYFHLMLDKHALLWAGGIASESFYPGPTAIKMLNDAQRAALLRLFPALLDNPDTGYGPTVRHNITRRQAELLVSRMSGVTGLPQKAA